MNHKKHAFGALVFLVGVPLVFGALSPEKLADQPFTPHQIRHWAFQKVQRPAVPLVDNEEWVRNPVDAFVMAKLEAKGLDPSARADQITLLRRAYFDLIGLPPMPEQVDAFLADQSPDAFKRVVDQLLASPHYGERWARHWLDLARYAESEGFKADETRPNVWRYRDYVIGSLNLDKPYDRFVREQIAGDELWPNNHDAQLGTAFNRHYPDEYNAVDLTQRRQEILNDITDTVGAVFLGLTYGCARCHDHKFDPILQADYYRLQAFFANTRAKDNIALCSEEEAERHRLQLASWEQKTAEIRQEMALVAEPKRKEILEEMVAKYPPKIQEALSVPAEERSPFQRLIYYKVKPFHDPDSYLYQAPTTSVLKKLSEEEKERWEKLQARLDAFSDLHPGRLPIGVGIVDVGREAPRTYILSGGAHDAHGREVQPGFLTLLAPGPAKIIAPEGLQSSGRRSALANWLVDPANPLTARVMVNRIWHSYFSRGLVETPSNLGIIGADPSHPQLLDWLANEFIRNGWSIKDMHRLIMNSNGCVATFKKQQVSDWSGRSGSVSCTHLEQLVDELNLSPNIRTARPPRLPLPDHVHCLVSLDRSPRRLKLTKPLLGFHSSFDCSMVLLQDVVQVLDRPVAATASQDSFLFHS